MSVLFHNQEVQLSLKNVIADLKCLSLNCRVDPRREEGETHGSSKENFSLKLPIFLCALFRSHSVKERTLASLMGCTEGLGQLGPA